MARQIIDLCPVCGSNQGSWGPRVERPEGYYHERCWHSKVEADCQRYRAALVDLLARWDGVELSHCVGLREFLDAVDRARDALGTKLTPNVGGGRMTLSKRAKGTVR